MVARLGAHEPFQMKSWEWRALGQRVRFIRRLELNLSAEFTYDGLHSLFLFLSGVDSSWNSVALEGMLAQCEQPPSYRLSNSSFRQARQREEALRRLADAIRNGVFVAMKAGWVQTQNRFPSHSPPTPQSFAAPLAEGPPATFELQVVFDADGTPIEQLSLEVMDPGRSSFRTMPTDRYGWLRVEHTVRGTASVAGKGQYACLERAVVPVGWGASQVKVDSAPLAKGAPPPRCLLELAEYRVKDGDTVESIAGRVRMDWADVAAFNCGARTPKEIDSWLSGGVGCTKRNPQGGPIFSREDWPGIILIPRRFAKDGLPTGRQNILRVEPASARRASWVKVNSYFEDKWSTPWPIDGLRLDVAGATVKEALDVDHRQALGAK